MEKLLQVTRPVTQAECSWLKRDIPVGTIVTRFGGCTYGCISYDGMAVNITGYEGFVELPADALKEIN